MDMTWAEDMPLGGLIRDYITPLGVLGVNVLLLFLIDAMCLAEHHETHSLYQRAVFRKSIIYLSLNMLFIPALTLSSHEDANSKNPKGSSLVGLLAEKGFDVISLLGQMYLSNNGIFFMSLVI